MDNTERKYCNKAIERMNTVAKHVYVMARDNGYKTFEGFFDLMSEYSKACALSVSDDVNFLQDKEVPMGVDRAKMLGLYFGKVFGNLFEGRQKSTLIKEFCLGAFGEKVDVGEPKKPRARKPKAAPKDMVKFEVVEANDAGDLTPADLSAQAYVQANGAKTTRVSSKKPNKSNGPKKEEVPRMVPRFTE